MANPLAGIGKSLGVTGTVLAAAADEKAQLQNMLEFERSASMARANAVASLQRGAAAAGRQRMAGSMLAGQQRVAYGMGGIDASSGTAAATQRTSAIFSELDAQTLSNNAVREAFGHKESARKYSAEAERIKARYIGEAGKTSPANAELLANVVGGLFGG